MFVRRNNRGLGASVCHNLIPYHVLGVDNVLRRYSPTVPPGTPCGNIQPEYPDRPGFNHVIRVGNGAHEFIVAGMPHPDSPQGRAAAAPAQPWTPPNQNLDPVPAPAAPVPVSQGSQIDVTTGTVVPMVQATNPATTSAPTEQKSDSGLLAILALGALVMFSGG